MTHVLLVVPRMIVPAVSGGEIRVLSLLRALSGRCRFSLAAFLEPGKEAESTAAALYLESRGVRTHLIRRGGPGARAAAAPELARSYEDAAMDAALKALVRDEGVDLVQLEFSQMAQYAPSLRGLAAIVATEHDASLLSPDRSYVRPRGGQDESRTAREYLRRVLGACDRVVAVSEADAARLGALLGPEKIRVVPTGVDLDAFAFRGLGGREAGVVAFLGHYAHYPNEDAAVFLCRDVLPELRRLAPRARVRLIGSGVTPAVEALRSKAVELTGRVERVAPHLSRARAFIAPMRLGFGIKGKLLEAFACGTPAVATPEACEAMPGLEPGVHLLVGRSPAELAAACASLLRDEALSSRLARAARVYVEERFGWERQAALLWRVYREALAARAA